MLKRILPIAMVAVALASAFGLLFLTQRLGLSIEPLDRFMKRPAGGMPTPEPTAEPAPEPETAA